MHFVVHSDQIFIEDETFIIKIFIDDRDIYKYKVNLRFVLPCFSFNIDSGRHDK